MIRKDKNILESIQIYRSIALLLFVGSCNGIITWKIPGLRRLPDYKISTGISIKEKVGGKIILKKII